MNDWYHDNYDELCDSFFAEYGDIHINTKLLFEIYPKVEVLTDEMIEKAYVERGAEIFDQKKFDWFVEKEYADYCEGLQARSGEDR